MAEKVVQTVIAFLSGKVPAELILVILSMFPIAELRGGLIAAALLKVPMLKAILICIPANMVPVPFILYLITPIFDLLKKTKLFRPLVEKLETKGMSKSEQIRKYEFWGLWFFVGIPLPGTGAWTGALIASLLHMDPKKCYLPIFCGLISATAIMCIITYGIPFLISIL